MWLLHQVLTLVVSGNSGLISFLKIIFGFELVNFVHVCAFLIKVFSDYILSYILKLFFDKQKLNAQ